MSKLSKIRELVESASQWIQSSKQFQKHLPEGETATTGFKLLKQITLHSFAGIGIVMFVFKRHKTNYR